MDEYIKATHQWKLLVGEKLKMVTAGLYLVTFDEDGFVGVDQDEPDDCHGGTYIVTEDSRLPVTENTEDYNPIKNVKCGKNVA